MELRAQLASVATGVDVQARSVDYENALIAGSLSMQWQLDPELDPDLAPQQRFDGLIVRRKAAYKVIQNQAGRFPEKYVFATLASRGNVFIGRAGDGPQLLAGGNPARADVPRQSRRARVCAVDGHPA